MNKMIKETNSVSELTKKQPNTNYSIDKNGVAYLSQRQCEELTGISVRQIKRILPQLKSDINLNKFNQLNEDVFSELVIYAAAKGKTQAIELLSKIVKAGVRVFLYGMAKKEQPISIDSKIEQLKSDNEELRIELNQIKTLLLENPEKINVHLRHRELTKWVDSGWIECDIKESIIRRYKITDIGKNYLHKVKSHIEEKI